MRHPGKKQIALLFLLLLLFYACGDGDYVPKPRGYFRIDFPEKNYRIYDSICPYSFEYPQYAVVIPDTGHFSEPCWINVEFPGYRGTLHISYKRINNNLATYFEDARNFVNKHIPKADDIIQKTVQNDSNNVWGIIYEIEGTGVASTYQFCVTDSSRHYLRGALYFNVLPNNDSLYPVLEYIKQDIDRLVASLRWK
jgi:gliding motility-associated lipoprotein GldD